MNKSVNSKQDLKRIVSSFKSKLFIETKDEWQRRVEIYIGSGFVNEMHPGVNHLLEHMISLYMRKFTPFEMINATTMGFTTEYYFSLKNAMSLQSMVNAFFNLDFSRFDVEDFTKQMQRIDSEFFFRQGLDDFFIAVKETVFEKYLPSVCGRLDYFKFDAQNWITFCREVYQKYYMVANAHIVYYGPKEDMPYFQALTTQSQSLNNDSTLGAYTGELLNVMIDGDDTTNIIFPKIRNRGQIIAFEDILGAECFCVFFLELTQENVRLLQQFYILIEFFINLKDLSDECETLMYYHYIENKIYDPYIQVVLSFLPSYDDKKLKNRQINAINQIEAFFTYFSEYYDSQYDLIQIVNKNPHQFTHHDQFMSLYYEARKTMWSKGQSLEFTPPTFSESDGEKIAKIFKNRIYYTAHNKTLTSTGQRLSAQRSESSRRSKKRNSNKRTSHGRTSHKSSSRGRTHGGAESQTQERVKLKNVHVISFKEQEVTNAHKILMTRLTQTQGSNNYIVNYMCNMAALCHCNTRAAKPRDYVPIEPIDQFIIIFNPVATDEEESHQELMSTLDTNLQTVLQYTQRLANISEFRIEPYEKLQCSFTIRSFTDDVVFITMFMTKLLKDIYDDAFSCAKNLVMEKDEQSQLIDNFTMFQFGPKAMLKSDKISFQFCVVPESVVRPQCQLLSKKKATEEQKATMMKLYTKCEAELGSAEYFFHLAKMQKYLKIPFSSLDDSFAKIEQERRVSFTRDYNAKTKASESGVTITIRELFDPDADNKFRVFWFMDNDSEQCHRRDGAYSVLLAFRRASERIFFDEYYYLECYRIEGVQDMCVFELGINSASTKAKITEDFTDILDQALKYAFSYFGAEDLLKSFYYVYPGRFRTDKNSITLRDLISVAS